MKTTQSILKTTDFLERTKSDFTDATEMMYQIASKEIKDPGLIEQVNSLKTVMTSVFESEALPEMSPAQSALMIRPILNLYNQCYEALNVKAAKANQSDLKSIRSYLDNISSLLEDLKKQPDATQGGFSGAYAAAGLPTAASAGVSQQTLSAFRSEVQKIVDALIKTASTDDLIRSCETLVTLFDNNTHTIRADEAALLLDQINQTLLNIDGGRTDAERRTNLSKMMYIHRLLEHLHDLVINRVVPGDPLGIKSL